MREATMGHGDHKAGMRMGPKCVGVCATAAIVLGATLMGLDGAYADEGGVSFWFPGQFGSLAAVPQAPGWSVGILNVYESVGGGGNVAAAREVTIGKFTTNIDVNLNVKLTARPDLVLVAPSYVFATPVLGGQLALSMGGAAGRSVGDIAGALTVSALGLTATKQGELSDARYGVSDLYPEAALRWNNGVNNWMTYATGDIPVGTYNSDRLANLGIGHGAVDSGAGYTYFDPTTGHEFSAVTGLTYNFVNPSTGYQNGVDWHIDWAASQFLSKTVHVGAVGYFYQQLTNDRGAAQFLDGNISRVAGIGPQVGFFFPAGSMQGYLNLKGFREFDAENRASGWSAWVTLAFSPKPP
jgi:hypothetical protein